MKNLIIALSLSLAVAAGAFALHERNQLRRLQQRLDAAESAAKAAEAKLQERTEADEKITLAEQKAKALEHTVVEQSAHAVHQSEQVAQLEKSLAVAKTNDNPLAGLLKDPAMKDMIKAQQKAVLGPMVDKMYAGWFDQASMSPEQAARLKELVQKKMSVSAEAGLSLLDGSLDASHRQDMMKQIKADTDAVDGQIKELLGDDNYKAFQKYEGSMGDRMTVGQFRDQLAGSAGALTPAQEAQLIDAIQQERSAFKWTTDPARYQNNSVDTDLVELLSEERLNKLAEESKRFNEQFLTRAGQILNADQLAQYQKFQDNQTQLQIAAMKMAAKMFGAPRP